ncbi:hypothetical protein [Hydrocarboniphaga sp.]|uniref:hypothetical protein n=1 Tax=Hydrocarboniphaga sp. TaxID=2033016 RepID=UPI003D0B406E
MKTEDTIHRSFCSAYAEAVLRFVVEGRNGDVVFDQATQQFNAIVVAADVPPTHCEWWVGKDWTSFVGPIGCRIDARDPQFSDSALRHEIVFALAKSPTGKRMSRILAGLD